MSFTQWSSEKWQPKRGDISAVPGCPYALTESTRWKVLGDEDGTVEFAGRLIGGCLDTIAPLAGSRYGDVPSFVGRCGRDGAVVYLENAELPPNGVFRTLWSLRLAGWFEGLSGVILGRSAGPNGAQEGHEGPNERYVYTDALNDAFAGLECPVVYDADIGHRVPQMTLINGALAKIECGRGKGRVMQTLA